MMIALLKKDFRVFLPITVGSIALYVLIYSIALLSLLGSERAATTQNYYDTFFGASVAALWLTGFMAATYGAAAFAVERRERSADFVAVLPVTRLRTIRSKIVAALSPIVIFWLMQAIIAITMAQLLHSWNINSQGMGEIYKILAVNAAMTIMAFGVAWLFSTILSSAAISFGISVASVIATTALIALIMDHSTRQDQEHIWKMIVMVIGPLGVAAFVSGTIYYLRRVAP